MMYLHNKVEIYISNPHGNKNICFKRRWTVNEDTAIIILYTMWRNFLITLKCIRLFHRIWKNKNKPSSLGRKYKIVKPFLILLKYRLTHKYIYSIVDGRQKNNVSSSRRNYCPCWMTHGGTSLYVWKVNRKINNVKNNSSERCFRYKRTNSANASTPHSLTPVM